MQRPKYNQRGFVVSAITFFTLIIMLAVAMSMSVVAVSRQKISTNLVKSTQAYYAAESGMEDALLRLQDNPSISSLSYSVTVGGATANVVIPTVVGASRVITSKGNTNGRIRNVEVVYGVDATATSFYYGAQIGEGGLSMSNGSQIKGNVFSSGNITGSGTIDNNVIVSGNGRSIKDVYVGGDVQSYSCLSGASVANLTYVTGGSHTCTVRGSTSSQSNEIPTEPMPISEEQIDTWKGEASQGTTIVGNYTIGNNDTVSLGPAKVTGNLVFGNGATLNVTGVIHVQGSISFGNTNIIRLDSSYGSLGGVILIDGTIATGNNTILTGSGQNGSYILILSTSTSDSAIVVGNNADGAVFYTTSGTININNNVSVSELVGYKVVLNNNAVLEYESGLANSFFSSGPSGGWKVKSWQEK